MGPASVRAITLDLYGTLLDVESSLRQAFADFLAGKGYHGSPDEVVKAWEAAYFQETMIDTLLDHGRTPFEQISRSCQSQVLSQRGVSHSTDDVDELISSRARAACFPM